MNQNESMNLQQHEVDSFGVPLVQHCLKLHKVTISDCLFCCDTSWFSVVAFVATSIHTSVSNKYLGQHLTSKITRRLMCFVCQLAAQSERTSKLDVQKEVQLLGVSDMICILYIANRILYPDMSSDPNKWKANDHVHPPGAEQYDWPIKIHAMFNWHKTWNFGGAYQESSLKSPWKPRWKNLSLDGKDLTTVHDHTWLGNMTLLKRL